MKQRAKKRALEEAEMRAKMGLPSPARVKWLSID
jgi:hypothetical protein